MKPMVTGKTEVQSDRACVVYDPETGRIHHVHRVVTLRGGAEPQPHEIEARARELATKKGKDALRLKTLMVAPENLRSGAKHRIDVKTNSLVSEPITHEGKQGG